MEKKNPLNIVYYEPLNMILFSIDGDIFEFSYYLNTDKTNFTKEEIKNKLNQINKILETGEIKNNSNLFSNEVSFVKFILFNRITNLKYYSEKITIENFIENKSHIKAAVSNFHMYFKNLLSVTKPFIIEYEDAETLKMKLFEYDNFHILNKTYNITFHQEIDNDDAEKIEEDIELEAEIREISKQINKPIVKDDLNILENQNTELDKMNKKLTTELDLLYKERDFDLKYSHLPGWIKYCKGTDKGCSHLLPLYGSNPYTLNLNEGLYCNAAKHSGVIDSSGGFYLVKSIGMEASFIGNEKNGITSNNFTAFNAVSLHKLDKKLFNKKFDICGNINF